jgi:hypothetical protein
MREILHRTTLVKLSFSDHFSGLFGKPFLIGAFVEYEGPTPEASVTVYASDSFGGKRFAEARQSCSPNLTCESDG